MAVLEQQVGIRSSEEYSQALAHEKRKKKRADGRRLGVKMTEKRREQEAFGPIKGLR